MVERDYEGWQPTETENHAAIPVPLKTKEKAMFQVSWIPVAIAVLQVIKESMDD